MRDAYVEDCLDEAFTEEANVVAMTDSALAYQHLVIGGHGIVDKHMVKHNDDPKELIRSVATNIKYVADQSHMQKAVTTH